MFIQWLLLLVVSLLAIRVQPANLSWNTPDSEPKKIQESNNWIIVCLIIITLGLYSGLSVKNDATTYLLHFIHISPNISISETISKSIGENPGFKTIQIIIKRYISDNPFIFKTIIAFITQIGFIRFYHKYSASLSLSLLFYIASGVFGFSIAVLKQMLSISIGLFAVPYLIERKYEKAFLLLILATTIHPYILMFLFIPFFSGDIWKKKDILILVSALSCGFFFEQFVSSSISITEVVTGDSYNAKHLTQSAGMNIFRVIFYSIVPILSYIYRNEINQSENIYMKTFISLSNLSLGFFIIGMFGGAVYFSRLAYYFVPFVFVSLPYLLLRIIPEERQKDYLILFIFIHIAFYYVVLSK